MRIVWISAACALLSGCVGAVTDAGCATYAAQRPTMPTLSDDATGRWVDVLDGSMTATCRR